MPFLGADDALPARPCRVLIAGSSGAGKTTLAGRVGRIFDLPHTELDSLYHGPGWTVRESFVADVERFSAQPRWVAEWQYTLVRDLLAARADLVVWLDLPRRRVLAQVTRRTVRRRLRRETLWNGNREAPLWTIVTDPEHIIRFAWAAQPRVAPRVLDLQRQRPDLPIVRLTSRRQVTHWCQTVIR